jgi:hypothetical protein
LPGARYRAKFANDMQGQRRHQEAIEAGIVRQHWFPPWIEIRPGVPSYWALDTFSFKGNSSRGIEPNMNDAILGAADMIVHL